MNRKTGNPGPAEHPSIQRLEQGARWVQAADKARARRTGPTSTKRSQYVAFGLAGAVALSCCGFTAYEQFFQRKRCIDPRTQQVIEDSYCRSGGGGYVGRWYYGGKGGSKIGDKVTGGSFTRGGFGRFSGGGG
ncbi:hypothetical protein [Luedemannella helvata]|uniref:Transmembrane protein n=1 Tax=Luedemannella helvata TaxID=349315 RepID=A0ABN2JQ83_9ACTN